MEQQKEKVDQIFGMRVKYLLFISVAFIAILLYTKSLDDETKKYAWITIIIAGVLYAVWRHLQGEKTYKSIGEIADFLIKYEYQHFGLTFDKSNMRIDIIDAGTTGFEFGSSGEDLITYLFDDVNNKILARIPKKLDAVKRELDIRKIQADIAAKKLDETAIRDVLSREGYELKRMGENI